MATDVLPATRVSGPVKFAADLKQLLRRGLTYHQAGEWPRALQCYQEALAIDPGQPDALNLTGVLAHQTGDHRLAVTLLERASALDPRAPDFAINLGLARQATGDLDRAKEAFERAVLLRPASKEGHVHLGTCRRLLGDLTGAIHAYDRALALDAEFAEAHATRGAALHALGRRHEAERALRRAIELKPGFAEAYSDLGTVLQAEDRASDAVESYRRAIELKPDFADAYANLGTALGSVGQTAEAIDAYRAALGLIPSHFESLFNLGLALRSLGRGDEAAASIEAARVVRPMAAEPYLQLAAIRMDEGRPDLGLAIIDQGLGRLAEEPRLHALRGATLKELGRLDDAAVSYRRAVDLDPASARVTTNFGNVLTARGDLDEAEQVLLRATALDPDLPEAHLSLGTALKGKAQFEAAVAAYGQALRCRPDYPEAAYNIGNAWRDAGRFAEAIAAYDHAIRLRPGYGDALWNQSLALLGNGQLARGWTQYEWRWRDGDRLAPPTRLGAPQWNGEPVAGARVLVWREQGLGDELMFLTCLPDLAAAGAKVTVLVSPRLVTLVQRAFPAVDVIGDGAEALGRDRGFDWQIPMGSLPKVLRNSVNDFGSGIPLLIPDPRQVTKWRERLSLLPPGKRIGLCWRSGLVTAVRQRNYAPWPAWKSLWQIPGVEWINLQYDDCDGELAEVEQRHGVRIRRWAGEDLKNDLESVTGLVASLDGVITAPTAVSAFAGGVGVPTWQVDSGSDWTPFGADRSPWFPSIRLFRKQPTERSFEPVIERVAAAVKAWVHGD